jgi:hypothetical protein
LGEGVLLAAELAAGTFATRYFLILRQKYLLEIQEMTINSQSLVPA